MKRRNAVMAVAMLVGLLTLANVTATAGEKKVKPSKGTKAKKTFHAKKALCNPGMLLSRAKELELTKDQQAQLTAIMKEMQAKVSAVLTKPQMARLKTLKPAQHNAKKMKKSPPAKGAKAAKAKAKKAKRPSVAKTESARK